MLCQYQGKVRIGNPWGFWAPKTQKLGIHFQEERVQSLYQQLNQINGPETRKGIRCDQGKLRAICRILLRIVQKEKAHLGNLHLSRCWNRLFSESFTLLLKHKIHKTYVQWETNVRDKRSCPSIPVQAKNFRLKWHFPIEGQNHAFDRSKHGRKIHNFENNVSAGNIGSNG